MTIGPVCAEPLTRELPESIEIVTKVVCTMYYPSLFIMLSCLCLCSSLTYNYGDGSYYVGTVDEEGRPRQGGIFQGIWGYNIPRNLGGSHKILQEMHAFFVAF